MLLSEEWNASVMISDDRYESVSAVSERALRRNAMASNGADLTRLPPVTAEWR
jgi:hypothetical protein